MYARGGDMEMMAEADDAAPPMMMMKNAMPMRAEARIRKTKKPVK